MKLRWRMARFGFLAVVCALISGLLLDSQVPMTAVANRTLAKFELSEFFGANWPDQPIEFPYEGSQPPLNTRMIGPAGKEVPFQWTSACDVSTGPHCILVRGYLGANARNTWTLESGTPPEASLANPVRLSYTHSHYEITNGLTGIRILAAAANASPSNRAPIQGILLPGGVWTGVSPSGNLLYSEDQSLAGGAGAPLRRPMYSVTAYNVTVTDAGPLKTVVKADYTFRRPAYYYGKTVINDKGAGHYTLIATVYANSHSVLLDEDSDMQFSYYVPVYRQLRPDQARFRGHDSIDASGRNSPICGYEMPFPVLQATFTSPIVVSGSAILTNGQRVVLGGIGGNRAANGDYFAKTTGYPHGQFALFADPALTLPVSGSGQYTGGGIGKAAYRGSYADNRTDGYLDITYSSDRVASYFCGPQSYRKLMTNYGPAAHSAGFYLMMYNSAGGEASPVLGIFAGRPSRQVMSGMGPSMPGLYSSDKHWVSGERDAGIQVDNILRSADGRVAPRIHRSWGIWTSRQSDLLPPTLHQPIGTEQNSLAGINLSHLYSYQLDFPDPPGGWKWLYLTAQGAGQIMASLKNGTNMCGSPDCYFHLLAGSEGSPAGRDLLTLWRDDNTAAVQKALDSAVGLARSLSSTLAVGDNHFDRHIGYYELGLRTSPGTAVLNAILMNRSATAAQRKTAKAALALFGSVFWDNDWFPFDNDSGEGYGLTNQIQQYLQYRAQSVAAAPSQPYLASKLTQALTYPVNDFKQYFSSTGAGAASTHYQSAFFEPLILNYLSFSKAGALSMSDPKWYAYANWELSLQTPPEPRFGNLRKQYSNGDGNTEADVRTGMLASALNAVNPSLAGKLMWAWQQSNSTSFLTEDSQFVTTLAVIDPAVVPVFPNLSSANFPGYHSVERHGSGTAHETVAWFINGGFYSAGGHRHADDGQVSIYAHSAPLAIDWNANLYSPSTPGRFMHNSVTFDRDLKRSWDADNPSLMEPGALLKDPTNTEFVTLANSTAAVAAFGMEDGTRWTRSVRTMAFNVSYPVIYVTDSFAGPGAAAGKTLTWNMMAAGAVETPAGPVNPALRFSPGCQSVAAQLPSNGRVYGLPAGLERFTFTGVSWLRHFTRGIDWDLYTISQDDQQKFFIGNWGHGCHPSRESSEFSTANGRPFAESQHILRIHGTSSFATILMPYQKTDRPVRTVTKQNCGVEILQNDETTCFDNSAAQYSRGTATHVLVVYDNTPQSAFGVRLAGGPQEAVLQSGRVVWTISGIVAGSRSLTMPGNWSPDRAVSRAGQTFTVNFAGGAQAVPVTIVFEPAPR